MIKDSYEFGDNWSVNLFKTVGSSFSVDFVLFLLMAQEKTAHFLVFSYSMPCEYGYEYVLAFGGDLIIGMLEIVSNLLSQLSCIINLLRG